jgi:hypothetical protein
MKSKHYHRGTNQSVIVGRGGWYIQVGVSTITEVQTNVLGREEDDSSRYITTIQTDVRDDRERKED